ncbi:BRCT domain-containing protein/zf-HC5HC2H domain-containing protein/zf-C3HC4_2 domain-containing protein [Cephalotus follicularis]|uniref:BRCT domain-containing protein/zf-HC5HC2H domain-containing protein/zf-C3HC4_2 domain-containing protein n=1 Tax=Cephalotus follicularis TaxID=3775 RepID=A0A1Q3CQ30_CEPFO|nr:BRCT domain-containing protein/zf-HC5HC2H domain-containing protein/zf-C3HC4_2 domain-containing protein [Cephalotus follicularis]
MINPCLLNFKKLGLELKCPHCLNLLKRPVLLPCDHIFCNGCIPSTTQPNSECPVCKGKYSNKDPRPVPFMENLATIFRSLDAAFSAKLLQSVCAEAGEKCPTSIDKNSDNRSSKESSEQSKLYLMTTKLPHVPVNHSVDNGIGKKVGKNHDLPPPGSQISTGGFLEHGTLKLGMNLVEQSLLNSPPSFSDMEGDSSEQASDHGRSPETYPPDRHSKRNLDDVTRQEKHDSYASGTEETHLWHCKRQKKLNYGSLQIPVIQTASFVSCSELEPTSGVPPAGVQLSAITDDSCANETICGFCQSSRISMATGPMLHYANGYQVEEEQAMRPSVLHVHHICIEWAPRVYYVGEIVKNLKAELARGAKLKCSRCGLKGAALGCYVKSCRRSYHVPCAQEISKCRWDHANYLVLCPAHSSVKFPNEKSGNCSENHIMRSQIIPRQSSLWVSPNAAKELVLCGSDLSSEDKFLLVNFANMIGATVSKFWKPNVTHVIVATDAKGACIRTLKVLMAILNGRWILENDWIKACMEVKTFVSEEPYEVSLDNHGCRDGPKTGRIRVLDNAQKLFDGLKFFFSGDFVSGYKKDLEILVIAAGGIVFNSGEELVALNCDEHATSWRTLVVYNLDPVQGSKLGEEISIIWQRLSEAEDLAGKIGGQVIGHTWLLESIAAYKLQPFVC